MGTSSGCFGIFHPRATPSRHIPGRHCSGRGWRRCICHSSPQTVPLRMGTSAAARTQGRVLPRRHPGALVWVYGVVRGTGCCCPAHHVSGVGKVPASRGGGFVCLVCRNPRGTCKHASTRSVSGNSGTKRGALHPPPGPPFSPCPQDCPPAVTTPSR